MDFLPDSGEDSCCESGAKMTKKSRRTHSPAFKAKVAFGLSPANSSKNG
ncbi:hypothetical protein ACVIU7_009660 [Bradyrhizobium liaoningense]|nr:hypothetical protein QIH91_42650 [Bradyrhizobium japonicum USDA 135]